MIDLKVANGPALVVATLAVILLRPDAPLPDAGLCSLMPGTALALVRVEQDTMLPYAPGGVEPMMWTGVAADGDTLLALPGTPMPAGRVRMLDMDSATRSVFASAGITDDQPVAFIRAAPYRADCRTIRWTDTVPFVERGEVGFVRGYLASREQWIDGAPVIIVPEAWRYPYPRRRSLAFGADADAPLAPAEAMFSLDAVLEMPRDVPLPEAEAERHRRAMDWARANAGVTDLEPVRTLIRRAVLAPDWREAQRSPSRLRGTYRVDLEAGGERATWFFRTSDRPGYTWYGVVPMTADLLASPHISGYLLVGYAAATTDALPDAAPVGIDRPPLVWLASADRPTAPDNDTRRELDGHLEFQLGAAPGPFRDVLEEFVPPPSPMEILMRERLPRTIPRERKQSRIPLTLRLDAHGGIRSDTTLTVGARTLRVVLERLDTLSLPRPY